MASNTMTLTLILQMDDRICPDVKIVLQALKAAFDESWKSARPYKGAKVALPEPSTRGPARQAGVAARA